MRWLGWSVLAGLCVLASLPASAQQSDKHCESAVALADDEWNASPGLEQCAAEGHADAQALLGMMYWGASASEICDDTGCIEGDPESNALPAGLTAVELRREGRRLLEAAAAKGQTQAQNELGLAAFEGGYGTMADVLAARTWFEASATGGDTIAPYNLARIHFGGLGVPVSEEKGEYFLRMSALRGYNPARCSLLKYLDDKGSPEAAMLRWTSMFTLTCMRDEILPELPTR